MVQKVIGLRLVRVGTDTENAVGQLRIFVTVVQFTDAHLARGVTFRVVGGPVVNSHHWCLEGAEHQLARAPGVFKAAAGAAVVKAIEQNAAGAIVVENLLGQSCVQRQRVVPAGVQPLVAAKDARIFQAFTADAIGRVHIRRHLAATRRRQTAVYRAFLVGHDHDVPALACFVADGVGHRLGHRQRHRWHLAGEVHSERVLISRASAFAAGIPFVNVIAAADDAEVACHVGLLRVFGRQRDPVFHLGAHAGMPPYRMLAWRP